jgi:hypothetical protein
MPRSSGGTDANYFSNSVSNFHSVAFIRAQGKRKACASAIWMMRERTGSGHDDDSSDERRINMRSPARQTVTTMPTRLALAAALVLTSLTAGCFGPANEHGSAPAPQAVSLSREPEPTLCTTIVDCLELRERAMDRGDVRSAMRHDAAGCMNLADLGSCRRLADLALDIDSNGAPVPDELAEHLKEAAEHTCQSSQRIRDMLGNDVTGRECAHLARSFVLAADPESRYTLDDSGRRFFESLYDPPRAARLNKIACERLRHEAACPVRHAAADARSGTPSRR